MPYPRTELEEMIKRFVAANDKAGDTGDWEPLAQFYAEDAIYSWNNGPKHEFVARGRKEIRDFVFGTEMAGLEKWTYPYVRTIIDDQAGEVIGIWRQVAPVKKDDGVPYEIAGTGGSWFRYGGNFQWIWQRDFFDHANAGAAFLQMAKDQKLSEGMQRRMAAGTKAPGWVRLADFDWYATLPKER
ncbi:MAG TPA: nuclear transport factor 2 family protein [Myxococcota bacterium]|jgi:SnoaL-like domain|nr:nuclear transport factor 2 family protein [Myxococcota bacterium]